MDHLLRCVLDRERSGLRSVLKEHSVEVDGDIAVGVTMTNEYLCVSHELDLPKKIQSELLLSPMKPNYVYMVSV